MRQCSWLHSFSKSFSQNLNKLPQQNGFYLNVDSIEFNCDFVEAVLLFETLASQTTKYHYKVLKMENDPDRIKKTSKDTEDFSPIKRSEEFRKFLVDGYRIRDLFYQDGINVLFEKSF